MIQETRSMTSRTRWRLSSLLAAAFALTLTNSGCVCTRDTSPALITSDEHGQVVVKANPDRSKSCEWLAPGPVTKVQVVR